MPALDNLKMLKKDMLNKGWVISSYCFDYNNKEYIALVILYQQNEVRDKYGLLKIDFLCANDINNHLLVEANTIGLIGNPREIREFFDIEYGNDIGDRLNAFYRHLGAFIPTQVSMNINDVQKRAMVVSLSNDDAEDANKIFCYKIRRNPKREDGTHGQRSSFNDNKTRLLRPKLYEKLKADQTLSFCYSDDPTLEKSDEEMLKNMNN